MELSHITYQGPVLDDPDLLADLPDSLRSLLTSLNGFVQFGGGLHVRGACSGPDWHSLRLAWRGPAALHRLFPAINPEWVPFAEDCVGDQFLLGPDSVLRLAAETGEVADMGVTLGGFLRQANADPVAYLSMQPLLQFRHDNGDLPDGYLLHAYPPFCTQEAARGVSLKPVPAWELHQFHAAFASALPEDGASLRVTTGE